MLAADVNLGYHDWRNWIVNYINGKPIRDFDQFATLLRNNDEDNVVLENENGYQMVINHADAMESQQEILERYRIPSAHSPGLFPE